MTEITPADRDRSGNLGSIDKERETHDSTSPQNARLHGLGTLAWAVAIAYLLALSYLTLAPDPWWFLGAPGKAAEQTVDGSVSDDWQHVTAYGLLGFLLIAAALIAKAPPVLAVAVAGATHGMATELAQYVIPLRTCDVDDAFANVVGVIIGGGAAFMFVRAGRLRYQSVEKRPRGETEDLFA